MRVPTSVAALAAVAFTPLLADAFVPTSNIARAPFTLRASSSSGSGDERSTKTSVCEIPSEFERTQSLVGVANGANAIRSAVVINPAGDFVRVDDAMKSSTLDADAPQIVIFLRHMG